MKDILGTFVKCACCGGTHRINSERDVRLLPKDHILVCHRYECSRIARASGLPFSLIEEFKQGEPSPLAA
jgi:hypothetical protein